jgi:hypothetical protein
VLLKRVFIEIEAADFYVRVLVLDGTGENVDSTVKDVCDSFHVVIEFSSAAAPQELAKAEKGVQDIGRITRALFVSAPHVLHKASGRWRYCMHAQFTLCCRTRGTMAGLHI